MNTTPNIKSKTIQRLLGNRKKMELTRAVSKKVERLNDLLIKIVRPQLYFQLNKFSIAKNKVFISDSDIYFSSYKLSKSLKFCEEMVSFVLTLGHRLDREIDKLTKKNRMSEAYILDLMGSVAAESVIEEFQKRMQKQVEAKGNDVSLRFSPGYCDWSIKEQRKLFDLLYENQSIVTINESLIMSPRKSISGVFGIYPKSKASGERYNPCLECNKVNCIARRI